MGGGGSPGSAQAGLPFGGIPPELQGGVDLLLAEEPERGESDAVFTQLPSEHEKKRLSLGGPAHGVPGHVRPGRVARRPSSAWPPSSARASSPTPSTTA